jgi:YHS domain-containing protein
MRTATRTTLSRRAILALAGVLSMLAPAFAAADPVVDLNLGDDRVAVNGYDPVAYFTDGAPVPGDRAYRYEIGGVVYLFSREETRQRFIAEPQRYLPAYGGFCAYGVRTGRKFQTDPNAWRIVDNRLYLLLNPATKAIWDLERAGNIQIANAIWPKIRLLTDAELKRRAL